ncbi:MAG: Coq4 family protein [Pseudobdellovibrio sp.]
MLAKIKRFILLMRGALAYINLIKNPEKLDKVIEISQHLAEPEIFKKIADKASAVSPTAKLSLTQRPRIDLATLMQNAEQLAPNSLGAQYLKFLRDRNLNPADLPNLPSRDANEFVQAHLMETHDLWHVICGFETDVAGELGLQAFYMAQLEAPLSQILIGGGFLNSAFVESGTTDERMSEIIRGWNMGKSAKQLFGVDWNQYWDRPLKEIQAEYRVS